MTTPAQDDPPPRRFQFTLWQAFVAITLLAVLLSFPFGNLLLGFVSHTLLEGLCPAVVILALLMLLQWPLLLLVKRLKQDDDSQPLD